MGSRPGRFKGATPSRPRNCDLTAVAVPRPWQLGWQLEAVWGANREEERGAAAERGFTPQATMMSLLDDSFACGKTQAHTAIGIVAVQSLEWPKHLLQIFFRDSDAVVFHREQPTVSFGLRGADVDAGGRFHNT